MSIRAIYENGIFKPLEDVPLKDGTEVDAYARTEEKGNGGQPRKSLLDNPAFGIWRDRDDIGTGIEYENRMRKYRREPDPDPKG